MLDDTKHIANELTELQDTYKTAIKSMNDYKKQLESETSHQTETNWEFEHPTKRSTYYEAMVVKMTKDIEELKNPPSLSVRPISPFAYHRIIKSILFFLHLVLYVCVSDCSFLWLHTLSTRMDSAEFSVLFLFFI